MSSSPRNRGSGVRSRFALGIRGGVTRPMKVVRSGVGGKRAGAGLEKIGLGLEGIGKETEVEMEAAEVGIGVVGTPINLILEVCSCC